MVQTHNSTNSGARGSGIDCNKNANVGAIPPQVPSLDPHNFGAFLVVQTQLIQSMMQHMQNMDNNPPNINFAPIAHDPPLHSKLAEFLRSQQPPSLGMFCQWRPMIGFMLQNGSCSSSSVMTMSKFSMQFINWRVLLLNGGRTLVLPTKLQRISLGMSSVLHSVSTMCQKGSSILRRKNFHAIKQEGMFMSDYLNKFTQPARYAPEDVATNTARQSRS